MAFIFTGVVMARILVKKVLKLIKPDNSPIRTHAYYKDMNGK